MSLPTNLFLPHNLQNILTTPTDNYIKSPGDLQTGQIYRYIIKYFWIIGDSVELLLT